MGWVDGEAASGACGSSDNPLPEDGGWGFEPGTWRATKVPSLRRGSSFFR
jgi:hypothetical protein